MSPLLTDFAGVSIYALGFTRGSIPNKFYIASATIGTNNYSASVHQNINNQCLWSFYRDGTATLMRVVLQADGTAGATYGETIYASTSYPGNAKLTTAGAAIGSTMRSALGNGYMQPIRISGSSITWQRSLGSITNTQNSVIDIDSNENVYAIAMTNGAWNRTGDMVNLAKYNSSGTIQWQKVFSASGYSYSKVDDLAVAKSDTAIFLTASYSTSNTPNTSGLLKVNSAGAVQWALNNTSTVSGNPGTKVTSDASDNAIVADRDFFAKFNTSGTFQWGYYFNTSYWNTDVTTDPDGNIYIARSDNTSLIVIKFNAAGTIQWQRIITQTGNNIYLGTSYNTDARKTISATNTSVTIAASNASKALLFKLPTDGSITGSYLVGSDTFTIAAGSQTFTSRGNPYGSITVTAANTSYTDAANSQSLTSQSPTYTQKVIP